MFNILKKTLQHRVVTVKYPKAPIRTEIITGKPSVEMSLCTDCGECMRRCPVGAVNKASCCDKVDQTTESVQISFNLDQCIFCSLCADICPSGAISMTHEFELAAADRDDLRSSPAVVDERVLPSEDYELIGERLKEKVGRLFGRSLQIREVDAGSCNACDLEINSLGSPYNDIERFGVHFVASPRHADMLLVTGPATRNMELALIKTYNATPDPKLVVAAGACACSGGIFSDSYATRNGIDRVLPVDVYIPGCPPRPQALIYGILQAIEMYEKKKR
ncbi:MAG: NADH-quinone oxidoreductase subunit NuoB [Clostridiales bacterium]|nr:NADH-quinone oxidoreductase subunit NuoB [Clostridiales bacterium]